MADRPTPGAWPAPRIAALGVAGAHILFFAYAIVAMVTAPAGDGTGFNVLAVFPLGVLFVVFTVPALFLSNGGRVSQWAALVLAAIGLGITQWLWWTILIYELNLA
jgi:hypothetical protein